MKEEKIIEKNEKCVDREKVSEKTRGCGYVRWVLVIFTAAVVSAAS